MAHFLKLLAHNLLVANVNLWRWLYLGALDAHLRFPAVVFLQIHSRGAILPCGILWHLHIVVVAYALHFDSFHTRNILKRLHLLLLHPLVLHLRQKVHWMFNAV